MVFRLLFFIACLLLAILLYADPHGITHSAVCLFWDTPNRMYTYSTSNAGGVAVSRLQSTILWQSNTSTALTIYYTLLYVPQACCHIAVAWSRFWWNGPSGAGFEHALKVTVGRLLFMREDVLLSQKCPNNQKFVDSLYI